MSNPSSVPDHPTESSLSAPATLPNGGYYDNDFSWINNTTARAVVTKVYPTAYKVYEWMDWMGGKVAWCLGLTQSRFQYAIDEAERIERRKRRKEEKRQQRAMEEEAYWREREEPYVPRMTMQKAELQERNSLV